MFKNKIYVVVEQGGKGANGRGQLWVYEPNNVPFMTVYHASDSVRQGCPITILGEGFDDYQGRNYPTLNGQQLKVIDWTDLEITALVPADAPEGKLAVAVYRDGFTLKGGFTKVKKGKQGKNACK